jgi:hypothetical protein
MFWILIAVLAVIGFFVVASRRRQYETVEDEPWRASLEDEEPLDWDAAREAEEEWLKEEEWEAGGDDHESWRG